MGDKPTYTCRTCRYSGPPFDGIADIEQVECRRNHPSHEGFPIMPVSSWCWDGTISEELVRVVLVKARGE